MTLQLHGPSSCMHHRIGLWIAALHRGGFLLSFYLPTSIQSSLLTQQEPTGRQLPWSLFYCICHEVQALKSFDRQRFQNSDSQRKRPNTCTGSIKCNKHTGLRHINSNIPENSPKALHFQKFSCYIQILHFFIFPLFSSAKVQ